MIAEWESWTEEERRLADALAAGCTGVVNVRKSGPHRWLVPWLVERELLTYVGHAGRWHDWPASPFANPFYREAKQDRQGALVRYERWLVGQSRLLRRIADGELTGRALGCWCAPLGCHADVLAARANACIGR
jgi:Domain of unknown function (DUF4326)